MTAAAEDMFAVGEKAGDCSGFGWAEGLISGRSISRSVSQSLELRFRDSPTFRSGHFAEPPAMQLERFVAKYLLSPRAFWGRYSVRLGCREARGERIYF